MDFQATQESVSAALVDATRLVNRISSEDLGFHRSLNPATATLLDRQNARLLKLAEKLLATSASMLDVEKPSLPDVDAVENNWGSVVDVIDGLLERVDTCLDEFTGFVKRLSPSVQPQATSPKPQTRRPGPSYRNQNIPKPQRLFEHSPNNHDIRPFKPLLTTKPHSTVPLQALDPRSPSEQYEHPYQFEIEQYRYPKSALTTADPIPYTPFEGGEATFVDTLDGVDAMIEELKEATEVAVDLEHHDTHSFIGIVSLMQISTRSHDWIVDTLKPWRRKLERLNEIFTDPKILKVLHGSHMDVIWLQRDLGLYLVGLFDTHHASRVLAYHGGSLAFLLKKFVNFDAQKQYQLADWRLRPLPIELIDYARSDTHFLLYIYDNLRNELIEKSNLQIQDGDLIETVLAKSKETSLQRYENPIYDLNRGTGPSGWFKLLEKTPTFLTKEQFAAFRSVHQWRDKVARQEDESTHSIMPNHVLFNIIREMPETVPLLLKCINPISSQVRIRATELLGVIQKARIEAQTNMSIAFILAETNELIGLRTGTPKPSIVMHESSMPGADNSIMSGNNISFRLQTSNFWGSLANYSAVARTEPRSHPPPDALLANSVPSLAFHSGSDIRIESDEDEVHTPQLVDHQFRARTSESNNPTADEVFSNPHRRESRKRRAESLSPRISTLVTEGIADAASASLQDDQDMKSVHEKLQRRADRKIARKARKETLNGTSRSESITPFEYTTAPSVLNAAKGKLDEHSPGKAFNPFTKSMDGPSGLGRAQNFTVGKTATFKR